MAVGAYQVEYFDSGSWSTIPAGSVIEVSPTAEASMDDAGAGFGDTTSARASIKVLRADVASLTWAGLPLRYTPTAGAHTARMFVGFNREASSDGETVTFDCAGITDDLGNRTKDLFSPLFERTPAATKTTASSIEDPTDSSYHAGPINYGLWMAGGRPYEQALSYPSALFYYSCDQAQLAPDYAWLAGENGYEEMRRLCRACGGQIDQRNDGVVRYKQPLLLVSTVAYTFSDTLATATDSLGVYGAGSPQEQEPTSQYFTQLIASFTPRRPRPMQQVIEDSTPRLIKPGQIVTIHLESDHPLKSVEMSSATTLAAEAFQIVYLDGRPVAPGVGGYLHLATVAAQRVTLVIENDSSLPFAIYRIIVRGEPITPDPVQTITVGSGQPIKQFEDNIFVQNAAHAERICNWGLAFYGTPRKTRTLSGCAQDPRRILGETVGLTSARLGLTNAPHIIIALSSNERGKTTDYTLLDAAGLPVKEDYYIVGTTDYTGQTKALAW